MHDGIPGNIIVRVRAQYDSNCRIVSFSSFHFIIHPDVHIHLPNILVCDLFRFQIDQHKAFKNIVIEHKINLVVLFLRMNMLLPCHKSIAFSKLHQKFLQV